MKRIFSTLVVAMAGAAVLSPAPVSAQSCGYYIVLGCAKSHVAAVQRLNALGGPGIGGAGIGGSQGTQVVHTNDYPNFRNGYFCVVDGPYSSRADAESIAWKEAVPDAYVKSGC
ncbi:MAG: hypothetical protein KDJ77_07735 [Rhodobiaceae bacterium]|nr:hypothetical protein [Rhodobiaceae bacterium]